jgi:hypothetical protein
MIAQLGETAAAEIDEALAQASASTKRADAAEASAEKMRARLETAQRDQAAAERRAEVAELAQRQVVAERDGARVDAINAKAEAAKLVSQLERLRDERHRVMSVMTSADR